MQVRGGSTIKITTEKGESNSHQNIIKKYQPDGELVINGAEAKVVRWIFNRYLSGDSLGKIAAGLEKRGISSPTGKAKWNREAISKLLSNEKYTGSVLLQKTLSFCGTQFKNDGELRY